MSVHEVLEYGSIVAHDEEIDLLVTVNGACLNRWIEGQDTSENTDCRHVQSLTRGRGLGEIPVAEAIEIAEVWFEDIRAEDC